MPRRREPTNAPLVLGLAVSIAVHLGVLVPLLVAVMTATTEAAPELESDFDAGDVAPPPIEPEIELGKVESKNSTLVWLGYDEYQEQLAAQSLTEQAAFDERPFGAMPTNPAPPSPDVPQEPTEQRPTDVPVELAEAEPVTNAEPDPLAQPSETEIEIEHESESVEPDLVAPVDAPDAQPTPLPSETAVAPEEPAGVISLPRTQGDGPSIEMIAQFLQEMLSTAQRTAEQMAMSHDAGRIDEHASPNESRAAASASKPTNSRKETETEDAQESKEAPRVTASMPAPPTEQPGEQREADQSDQESDATSVEITMDELKVGKPLVSQGLELKPRKPTFTQLIRMTSLPGNPHCEIRFQSNGKPALARLLTSSGDSRVDDAVLASLYRWRANGPPLEELGEDETITVRIQIIFNAR